jgi:hypothetical protein
LREDFNERVNNFGGFVLSLLSPPSSKLEGVRGETVSI